MTSAVVIAAESSKRRIRPAQFIPVFHRIFRIDFSDISEEERFSARLYFDVKNTRASYTAIGMYSSFSVPLLRQRFHFAAGIRHQNHIGFTVDQHFIRFYRLGVTFFSG